MLALPGGYLLAFHSPLGPLGVWSGLALGLAFAAVLLGRRFHQKTSPANLTHLKTPEAGTLLH